MTGAQQPVGQAIIQELAGEIFSPILQINWSQDCESQIWQTASRDRLQFRCCAKGSMIYPSKVMLNSSSSWCSLYLRCVRMRSLVLMNQSTRSPFSRTRRIVLTKYSLRQRHQLWLQRISRNSSKRPPQY